MPVQVNEVLIMNKMVIGLHWRTAVAIYLLTASSDPKQHAIKALPVR
jgi:hypothetical protein